MKNKPYVCYGEEWEKSLMRVDKKTIIGMFRNLALSYQQCKDDFDKLYCELRKAIEAKNEPKTPNSNL